MLEKLALSVAFSVVFFDQYFAMRNKRSMGSLFIKLLGNFVGVSSLCIECVYLGEHTMRNYPATVHGALLSGFREA